MFTDGSKDDQAVGAASHSPTDDKVCGLNPKASIFTAESTAIKLALDSVTASSSGKFIIYSDSLSALQAIENMNWEKQDIQDILETLNSLKASHKEIVFCWIPSHVGIQGNETVDELAKIGLELDPKQKKLPHTDFKPAINNMIKRLWQKRWDQTIDNKLYKIQNKLGLWPKSLQTNRRDEAVLTRLRLGHTSLTHSFLLKGEDPPNMCTV